MNKTYSTAREIRIIVSDAVSKSSSADSDLTFGFSFIYQVYVIRLKANLLLFPSIEPYFARKIP